LAASTSPVSAVATLPIASKNNSTHPVSGARMQEFEWMRVVAADKTILE
jgi:hypothetical protein